MRVSILQSNYIPWKGYFDLMAMSDMFVVYDSVQYTKNDWRNRNMIATASGPIWLTIPIATSGRPEQRINEAVIDDRRWARKHWSTIAQNFARRPHFADVKDRWESEYLEAQTSEHLHDVNLRFLRCLANQLSIDTVIVDDRDFELEPDTPTGKLVQLCRRVGADRYVTGPAGLSYLEVERFHAAGIALDVIDYRHYPEYSQTTDEFRHGVSVLDLIASVGNEAANHLQGRYHTIEPHA